MTTLLCRATAAHDTDVTLQPTTGIDVACQQQPDLIVLALDLPDVDGKVVARFFRNLAQTVHVPIIAITADARIETKHLAMDFGCDLVVQMPIDTRVFADQVARYLADAGVG